MQYAICNMLYAICYVQNAICNMLRQMSHALNSFRSFDAILRFFLHISSCSLNVRLHTETWLCNLPGSSLKVPVVGGWWWFYSEYSDRLWLSSSLGQAEQ